MNRALLAAIWTAGWSAGMAEKEDGLIRVNPYDPPLKECSTCAAKPGSPTLCKVCLQARELAGKDWQGQ